MAGYNGNLPRRNRGGSRPTVTRPPTETRWTVRPWCSTSCTSLRRGRRRSATRRGCSLSRPRRSGHARAQRRSIVQYTGPTCCVVPSAILRAIGRRTFFHASGGLVIALTNACSAEEDDAADQGSAIGRGLPDEDSYESWLRYRRLTGASAGRAASLAAGLTIEGSGRVLDAAGQRASPGSRCDDRRWPRASCERSRSRRGDAGDIRSRPLRSSGGRFSSGPVPRGSSSIRPATASSSRARPTPGSSTARSTSSACSRPMRRSPTSSRRRR